MGTWGGGGVSDKKHNRAVVFEFAAGTLGRPCRNGGDNKEKCVWS